MPSFSMYSYGNGRRRRNNMPPPHTVRPIFAYPQIVIGTLTIIINAALIGIVVRKDNYSARQYWGSLVAAGIWGGLFFMWSGYMVIVATKKNSMGALVCHMCFSILNINIAFLVLAMGVMAAFQGSGPCFYTRTEYRTSSSYTSRGHYWCEPSKNKDYIIIGFGATLTVLGFMEVIMAICSLAMICCCRKSQETPHTDETRPSTEYGYNMDQQPYSVNMPGVYNGPPPYNENMAGGYMVGGNHVTQYGHATYAPDMPNYGTKM